MNVQKLFSVIVVTACFTGVGTAVADVSEGTAASDRAAAKSNIILSEKDVADVNNALKVQKRRRALSAKSLVQKDIEDYFSERGITPELPNESGDVYFSEIVDVGRNVKDSDFISSRALAFDKAYQNALAKYVKDRFARDIVESNSELFHDQSSGRLAPTVEVKDAVARVAEKTTQLAEAQLDSKLRNLGKNPKGSIVAKRKLFVDMLVKRSMARAIGSSSGVLPVQSFEGWTANGKYAVGVVVRCGLVTENIANCLCKKCRPNLVRPTGKSVKDVIPGEDDLISQFGVRVFIDETGTPALLSFGQWGVSYTGTDEDMLDRSEDSARRQAQRAADEAITQFVNSIMAVAEESERGESIEESALFDSEGNVTDEGVKNLIDRTHVNSTLRGEDTMIGRSTPLPPVILEHPSGHEVAICVRMWSFRQYDAMKKVVDQNLDYTTKRRPPQKEFGETGSGTRRGRSFDF